jgi:hypothetical protein
MKILVVSGSGDIFTLCAGTEICYLLDLERCLDHAVLNRLSGANMLKLKHGQTFTMRSAAISIFPTTFFPFGARLGGLQRYLHAL